MKLNELTALARRLPPVEITGITADSRLVKAGYLFAALPGSNIDGRAFIEQAVEDGAFAVLALPGTKASVPVIESEEPRLTLAQIAMRFHAGQPEHVAGITGTNGKTSVARFTSQIWNALGKKAGSLGTLGAVAPGYDYALRHTTPDPVEIHQILSTMAAMGTTHLAMEVSSHGLSQHRADGVSFKYAAFTNITQDHLDYHPDFRDYFSAKMRLLTELLPVGATAVINADGPGSDRAAEAAVAAGRKVFSVGRKGKDIVLKQLEATVDGLSMDIQHQGRSYQIALPLIGAYQADNALVAAGLAIVSGLSAERVFEQLSSISAAPGRMQLAGIKRFADGGEATAYVDYAHTPDAIATALAAIRPHADGDIHIVFGAGGDRDRTKRPLMAKAAASAAQHLIITDDNPRSEDPAAIRAEVQTGAPSALNIGGRADAIAAGVAALKPGDVLLVAGKGHELGQTIEGVTYPFDDVATTSRLMAEASEA
ncbi:UDP-N-acetylmuramoyl-L-alanyl-D-glutamate--2,6-diaminopimelate ligase [Parvularcula sp. LCG005]|uniref:UDP-N-acetylmuramoyl-L-alanyl-D-glutamate--2, 6-diaminopimelate ligase n=1 Tax=Parvularcula sp. LCG005 TaxID=3078805 RepID=UPI002942900E|nr:UDP-N-acetylmuramoyl-L-alanyl-D-glutamate--2,6-diaminopimelate ligase [Parvularcula sp. LCG005]WOI54811.1 UDP-N-acetylmuramoyl-L-alanyl-D-glutamate--2,6-diaminopimelate ligase [Parvularcula sp. LCG005]